MKKLKLNPIVLDTMSNEELKEVFGGVVSASDTKSSVVNDSNGCKLCTVTVTPKK